MDAENSDAARSRLLDSVPSSDGELAAQILAACPAVDIVAGEPYFRSSLPPGTLLIVERGFVILRVAPPPTNRSIVTCDAGPGRVVLPPASEEVLFALVDSRVTVISPEALDALLALPGVAKTLLEQLARTLAQNQEAIGNFGNTRHIERVRRKLLQLARNDGRVTPDGVRIDFPLNHTLLADMVGSSRETVTRSLDESQREGFVARQGRNPRPRPRRRAGGLSAPSSAASEGTGGQVPPPRQSCRRACGRGCRLIVLPDCVASATRT